VVISGACDIGENNFHGVNATVVNDIIIGADCLIGAGAVVTKDVPEGAIAVGVPARVVKMRSDMK